MGLWRACIVGALIVLGGRLPVSAQPVPNPSETRRAEKQTTTSEREKLNQESEDAFERKDFKAAEAALRKLVKIDADNFVPWYNLACALSMQKRTEDAGPMLEKAIELGFTDLRQMEIDPHLADLRRTPNYKKLVEKWPEILAAHADSNLDRARAKYGPSYTYEKDEKLRLAYASAFSAGSFAQAKSEIAKLAGWWSKYVTDPAPILAERKPGQGSDLPWVLVLLPTPTDYAKWASAKYGPAWERIGGVYSNDEKSLVAKDLGSTLRHEFWHVMHWRDMDARGQRHPIWIMEGLCSVVEDVEAQADGSLHPIASWRTNQAGRLARTGKLTPWETLFKLDQKKFIGSRPLAFYGQSRAIFMFLMEEGKLKDWYAAYTDGYAVDPTGASAFEKVFKKPMKKVEAEFRAWLRQLPEVAEDFPVGSAVLPFNVEEGGGDGLVVAGADPFARIGDKRGRNAGTGAILPKDIITAIDDKPVREVGELIRLLADYTPGVDVKVTYRRGKQTNVTTLRLMEKR